MASSLTTPPPGRCHLRPTAIPPQMAVVPAVAPTTALLGQRPSPQAPPSVPVHTPDPCGASLLPFTQRLAYTLPPPSLLAYPPLAHPPYHPARPPVDSSPLIPIAPRTLNPFNPSPDLRGPHDIADHHCHPTVPTPSNTEPDVLRPFPCPPVPPDYPCPLQPSSPGTLLPLFTCQRRHRPLASHPSDCVQPPKKPRWRDLGYCPQSKTWGSLPQPFAPLPQGYTGPTPPRSPPPHTPPHTAAPAAFSSHPYLRLPP